MFNIQSNDEQLVDLLVTFGEAFPMLDADGNELEEIKATPGIIKLIVGQRANGPMPSLTYNTKLYQLHDCIIINRLEVQ